MDIEKTNEKFFSNNYFATKQREYMNDYFKYAIHKQNVANLTRTKYHSCDDNVREEFREQRKQINRRYYLKKKAAMLEAAKVSR